MNPCPCGWLGHASGRCHCTPDRIARYRQPHLRSAASTGSISASKCRRSTREALAHRARRAVPDSPATVTSAQRARRGHGGARAADSRARASRMRAWRRARSRRIAVAGRRRARRCSRKRWRACRCRRAPITGSSRSRGRSPIWRTVAHRGAARRGGGRLSALRPDVRDRDSPMPVS